MDYKQKSIEFKEKIQSLKDEFIQDILTSDLTKLEQIKFLSSNKLFGIKDSIAQPFFKFKIEFTNIIRNNPDFIKKHGVDYKYGVSIDDVTIKYFDRHETIDFGYFASDTVADAEDDKIEIFTNSCGKEVFYITTEQYIDCVYEWCVENKCVGFKIDW